MSTKFYTFTPDRDPDGPPIVAVDHEDRVYFYLGNDGIWHHSRSLEIQLDTNDGNWTAAEVPSGDVPALISAVRQMSAEGISGSFLQEYLAQPPEDTLTSAQLGLSPVTTD